MMKKAWSEFRSVQSTPNFTFIILSQMVAITGSGLLDIVLIWYALKESSYVAASTVIALQFIPYTGFGPGPRLAQRSFQSKILGCRSGDVSRADFQPGDGVDMVRDSSVAHPGGQRFVYDRRRNGFSTGFAGDHS
ncbi:MAG: hypothetical protein V6Z86_08570 [Hyphomicrobiales bacterium]